MSKFNSRAALMAVFAVFCLVLAAGYQGALAQELNDLNTELPPPPLPQPSTPTSEGEVDNGDGTWTFTQTISGASTAPHYTLPSNGGGFDVYSYFNQDYGWQHDFPYWNDPNLQVIEARLTIVAWDIDSEPSHGYDGEYDGVHVDGTLLDPGYLQGNNREWSTTVFSIQRSAIVDDGYINVWLNIDMHHNEEYWATTLDHCELQITYSVGDPNNQPYEPELVIYPECPGDHDFLIVTATGPDPADPNGDDVTYEYRWFVDIGTGQYIDDEFAGRGDHTGNSVPASDTVEGDLWRVQVLPIDSTNQRGDYATATWPEAIGCDAVSLEILDGNPRYLNGVQLGMASYELDLIATGGQARTKAFADGNSLMLIRFSVPGPGQATLTLNTNGGNSGTLKGLDGVETTIVDAVETSSGYKAFWIYTPPESFFGRVSLINPISSISVSVNAFFSPEIGFQTLTESSSILLRRPPTLLVHGIWSSREDSWGETPAYYQQAESFGFPLILVNYSSTTQRSFDFNYAAIVRDYERTMDYYRREGFACSQVNVVAHSMGGNLTRRWARESGFYSAANFNNGPVNLLVTIDTPHSGSPLASAYKSLVDFARIEAVLGVTGPASTCQAILWFANKRYGEGVEDLIPGSSALVGLGATNLPTHVIYGAGGTDSFGEAHGSERKFRWLPCPQYINTGIFEGQEHDYIVPVTSQLAGLSQPFVTRQVGIAGEHTSATKQLSTVDRVFDLLRFGSEDEDFSPSIPAPSSAVSAIPASVAGVESGNSLWTIGAPDFGAQECSAILSPIDGSTIQPGTEINIAVDLQGLEVSYGLFIWDGQRFADIDPETGIGVLSVLDVDCGAREGFSLLVLEDGTVCKSPQIQLNVVPAAGVIDINVLNSELVVSGPNDQSRFVVGANYSDGVFRPANSSILGTSYAVANPLIAEVDAAGTVRALRPGSTEVTISNGAATAQAEIHVLYAVANADPIVNLVESYETCLGDTLILSAVGSYDPDARPGEILAYAWDLDSDGAYDDAFGEEPRVTVLAPGEWDIGLEVRDISGGLVTATAHLTATFCGAIIDGVLPDPPVSGAPIQIIGRLFGDDQGEGNRNTDTHNVTFAGVRIPDEDILAWDTASIQLRTPVGIYSGVLVVTVEGIPSNEFSLEYPNVPPDADAGPDFTAECEGPTGTLVTLDGSGSTDRDGDTLTFTWSYLDGTIAGPSEIATAAYNFSPGAHEIILTVADGISGANSDTVLVTVADTTPPQLVVTALPGALWPPNHKMVNVEYTIITTDQCDEAPTWRLVDIVSSDPDNGTGDGDTPNDIQEAEFGTPDSHVQLRAERSGDGSGRTYRAIFEAIDAAGNTTIVYAHVTVPHAMNERNTVLGEPGSESSQSDDVTYMVSGKALWGKKAPARLLGGEGELQERLVLHEPVAATICNTAGAVPTGSFYLEDVDRDGVRDILASFDRLELLTLKSISSELDGNPVFALEMVENQFIILDLDNIQDAPADLAKIVAALDEAAVGADRKPEALAETHSELPQVAQLLGAAPNPFNPRTTISFAVPGDQFVSLAVFDISGRRIVELVGHVISAGKHDVVWSGLDSRGVRVASGVYFYRMKTPDFMETKRMLLIK